ncbi:TPA: hypothetical protein NV979_004150 [Escherichia coli]|nr:hypothetical protein [Escherichia coli]HCJ9622204.1 hypothetical protein [Escherichia coli]
MHRIDTKTAQKDKFGAGKNGFTRGNPQTGTPATDLDDDYFDMLQEELCSVVEASGASLEKGRHDQLLTALRALLLSRKNPFGDIKSDGTVETALENLGLGTAAEKNVGTASGQIPDMSSFVSAGASNVFSSIVIAGNRRIMEGRGSGNFVNGVLRFTLPLAYPSTGFTFIPTDVGSGVVSYAAIPESGSVVTIYGKDAAGANLNGSFSFKYMAMGSA